MAWTARPAPADVVPIHPVVVDEEISLEELHGHAGHHHRVGPARTAIGLVCRREEDRPEALPPAQAEGGGGLGDGFEVARARRERRDLGLEELREAEVDRGLHPLAQAAERRAPALARSFNRSIRHGSLISATPSRARPYRALEGGQRRALA